MRSLDKGIFGRFCGMPARSVIIFLVVFFSGAAACFASELSGRRASAMVRNAMLDSASVAVRIVRLSDGEVIEDFNSSAALIPASIMKCVTTASLMVKAGADDRYVTGVFTEGDVDAGALKGNLVVVASGDPSLNSRCEPRTPDICAEIADALSAGGIDRIEGRIVVDQSIFQGPACPESWQPGDLRHSYGTGCHSLNFENNSSGKSSVANPSAVFERRLRDALAARGITVGGESMVAGERRRLLEHESATSDEIMRSCMMRSDNLFAEALLRMFALANGRSGSTAAGAELEHRLWRNRKLDMSGVRIVDGSGLSRSNRVTAGFMTGVLAEMSGDPVYASYFPLAGEEGTLKRFLAGTRLESYVAMKTGSMSGIQCYAGYKLDDEYAPTHSIVIIINNMKTRRSVVREELQRMLLDIFQ